MRPPPTQSRIVAEAHEATYADPIRVRRGEILTLTGREEEWDGHRWVWAIAGGREGWVPDDLPDEASPPRAARDYSAVELTVRPGERLIAIRATHGWAWCLNDDGDEGWVPERCLSED